MSFPQTWALHSQILTGPTALAMARNRAAVMAELRRLMPRMGEQRKALPFGLAAIDSHLPDGGLACGALHEVVPAAESCIAAAFGFIAAVLGRLAYPLVLVMPAYGLRPYRPHGRLHGHGLNALGLDPGRLILVETTHRKETLWAMEEAVRSAAPAAVVGVIDTLDLKLSQRLHLAATEAGLPLFLLRPAPSSRDAGKCERGGDALAHRHRASRARPFRPRHAAALAFAT